MTQKVIIGYTDYSRIQLDRGDVGLYLGSSPEEFLEVISHWENMGYKVEFVGGLLRSIFCLTKYKIVATK